MVSIPPKEAQMSGHRTVDHTSPARKLRGDHGFVFGRKTPLLVTQTALYERMDLQQLMLSLKSKTHTLPCANILIPKVLKLGYMKSEACEIAELKALAA
jgi:hypothetical protein